MKEQQSNPISRIKTTGLFRKDSSFGGCRDEIRVGKDPAFIGPVAGGLLQVRLGILSLHFLKLQR